MFTVERSRALGSFLRVCRERLSLENVDLPRTSRRRTPGLRREEVAALAGISSTWYVRIEQGKDVSASAETLNRIARALQLSTAERAHLFALAERRDPATGAQDGRNSQLGELQRVASALSVPAYVIDRQWNVRAWNESAASLFKDWLGQCKPNLLLYVFLDPGARDFIVDWENRARRLVAECRAEQASRPEDPGIRELVDYLRVQSPQFALLWDEQHVLGIEGGVRQFVRNGGYMERYEQISLKPTSTTLARLVVLLPSV